MPYFSALERAALHWCEALIKGEPIDDAHYQEALNHFGEQALMELAVAVNAINSWNRLGKAFKPPKLLLRYIQGVWTADMHTSLVTDTTKYFFSDASSGFILTLQGMIEIDGNGLNKESKGCT